MKALVTGGAGFIGSNIALALEAKGATVMVADDFSSARFENLKSFRGEVIGTSVNDFDFDTLGNVDVVYHEAALTDTTVSNQKMMMHANVEGFRKILEFAVRHKSKLIFASSAAVYGNQPALQSERTKTDPLNIYGYSKLVADRLAERAIRDRKIQIIGLRYFNVYGMGEQSKGKTASMIYQLAEQMRSGKRPRIFHDGEQMRDHIYVKDVVQANLLALDANGSGIVNVGTGTATTFNRVIELLNHVLSLNLEPDYFDNPYPFYQNKTQADPEQAERLIGFKAKFSVEDGIRDYFVALYQTRPGQITTSLKQS
ncbi:MAG: ADP-glyceromanno-heptose 6-epimerase [Omnitrophica bacterium RIFCSPHIGHO2_02_FULL_49_9]|nr:MAG: ADP-glyceromanno-heptose 6-epimerase [Omnitrophica bacterium RIFCSPHIGHO2_02_FULL_49_9]